MPRVVRMGRVALFVFGCLVFLAGIGFFATADEMDAGTRRHEAFMEENPDFQGGYATGNEAGQAAVFRTFGTGFVFLGLVFMGIPATLAVRSRAGPGTVEVQGGPGPGPREAPREVVRLRCRACGSLAPEDSRFCGACAQPL